MSIGPLGGLIGSVAGSPLAQTKGSEVERSQREMAAQDRQVRGELKAEAAAGIGETDGQDHETGERDADGRRLWEKPAAGANDAESPPDNAPAAPATRAKDPSGQSGSQLDLSG